MGQKISNRWGKAKDSSSTQSSMLGLRQCKASDHGASALWSRFLDPLVFGDYPNTMKQNVGSRLPAFTDDESKLVKGSFDFIGVIHYSIFHVRDNSKSLKMENRDFYMDAALELIGKPLCSLLRI